MSQGFGKQYLDEQQVGMEPDKLHSKSWFLSSGVAVFRLSVWLASAGE